MHLREKNEREDEHAEMGKTKNSMVNIGSAVLMEYEEHQESSMLKLDSKVTSLDDVMRENFKFSPAPDGNHPVLHLASDLSTIKEPASVAGVEMNDSPRFNTGPHGKEDNFNFNSQTMLRQKGLQNLDEFGKHKTFHKEGPQEGNNISSEIEIEVESQEFIPNLDQQSITMAEHSHNHEQANFTPFPIETSINNDHHNNSPFLTEKNLPIVSPFTDDQNPNMTPFPTEQNKSLATFPAEMHQTQNKQFRNLGLQQTRLQTLNNSLQDLEIARSSQLDVGQYQNLIQSIVCSASLLNKKKLAALKQQKRQQSNLRRKIKKDVEKFNQLQGQRLPQLLGKTKSQA